MKKWVLLGMIYLGVMAPFPILANDYVDACTDMTLLQLKGRATKAQAKTYCQCNEKQIEIIEQKMESQPAMTQAQVKKMFTDSAALCLRKAKIK